MREFVLSSFGTVYKHGRMEKFYDCSVEFHKLV